MLETPDINLNMEFFSNPVSNLDMKNKNMI